MKETGIDTSTSNPIHFVVVTIGSAGDLFPFMAMALALRAAGHRVTLLAPVQHGPFVAPSGLDFVGLPADEAVLHDPDLWHPTRAACCWCIRWRCPKPTCAALSTPA